MIYLLTTKRHTYTVKDALLADRALAGQLKLLPYENLFRMRSLHAGTYIFSDIERLDREATEKATIAWNALDKDTGKSRLLNHPIRSMRRFELLRNLYTRGINNFNVYRLTDPMEPERFPVFIRSEDDHRGSTTELLNSSAELAKAKEKLINEGRTRENKIVTEFCDVANEKGIYHWYGAHRVGSRIFPVFLHFTRKWMSKDSKDLLADEELTAAHQQYVASNPHESLLLQIFDIANIQYGRIDYAMVDGRIQVFEINTNPMSLNATKLSTAIKDIDLPDNRSGRITIDIPRLIDKPSEREIGFNQYLFMKTVLTRLHLMRFETPIADALKTVKRLFLSKKENSI